MRIGIVLNSFDYYEWSDSCEETSISFNFGLSM